MNSVLARMAAEYPQLYLNPDTDTKEAYCRVVLKGEEPEIRKLDHYTGSLADRDEVLETPAGPVRVVTLGNRQDFELVMRGFLAAKDGPLAPIPESQGAATLTVFNWARIHAHLALFPIDEQTAEFRRFISVRENYLDMLIILSRGPYSNVQASAAGCSREEWLAISDTIRRYHELTHFICRRMYPDDIDPVRDEMVADTVGLYAAYGHFDPELEKLFLGIKGDLYIGGRLENYTKDAGNLVGLISNELGQYKNVIDAHRGEEPFSLIPALMGK